MDRVPVYFMPGLAASPRIFEHIKLPEERYSMHFLNWIDPFKKESITDYCARLATQITHVNPVLIGVSFGGMIVQELSELVTARKVVIISSAKTRHEYPRRMRLARATGLHKLLPLWLINKAELLVKYNFGIAEKKIKLYYTYLGFNDTAYLKWAFDSIIHWDRETAVPGLVHIHGDRDPVFPVKYIDDFIPVENGTHIIIVNRYRWFNENLPALLES